MKNTPFFVFRILLPPANNPQCPPGYNCTPEPPAPTDRRE